MKLTFNNWRRDIVFAIAPILIFGQLSIFGGGEFKKEYNKEFTVDMDDKLMLNNRYGKIEVKTWDQPKVKVDVTVIVDARNEDNAQEVFDRIKIEFGQTSGMVSVKTEIEEGKSWGSWLWGSSSSEFEINYLVYMPSQHDLDLSNKYGHSWVEDFSGTGKMNVKYGDLFAGNIKEDLELYVGYGNATVGTTKKFRGEVKYGKLVLDKCADMNLEIKYSKLNVESANKVRLVSGYDDIHFGSIDYLDAYVKYSDLEIHNMNACDVEAKYTDVHIENLNKEGDFEMGYGGLRIDDLAKGFSNLDITGKYTGIKIHPSSSAAYRLSAWAKYASIHYPDGMKISRDIDSNNTHEIEGYQNDKNGGTIKVNSSYGSVKIY